MSLHAQFALVNRNAIENEIERLIGLLDAAAPDCDLEDDDPGGCSLDRGEGLGHFGQGLYPELPRYGLDQSTGPTNHREAERARYRRMMAS